MKLIRALLNKEDEEDDPWPGEWEPAVKTDPTAGTQHDK